MSTNKMVELREALKAALGPAESARAIYEQASADANEALRKRDAARAYLDAAARQVDTAYEALRSALSSHRLNSD